MTGILPGLVLRDTVAAADVERIAELVAATGFFSAEETAIAAELAAEAAARGAASGYLFLLAAAGDRLVGYTCYGPIPATSGSFDLYWIAVAPDRHRQGLGRRLLAATEAAVLATGGRRLFVDTSSRPQYAPTRAFYRACGFREVAVVPHFYQPGEHKVIFAKHLVTPCRARRTAECPTRNDEGRRDL
ncbi:MAG: GNAT family N-acetyltransferase [Thermodesulfobacteriota bacterium]